ncbi:MAG: hypothetical protein H7838_11610 [Magnetococcus sp. DMHC-8]
MPSPYPPLNSLFALLPGTADAESRAQMDNFCHDERPSKTGQQLYSDRIAGSPPITTLHVWQQRHAGRFLERELFVDPGDTLGNTPWTFRSDNENNWIHPHVARNRQLVRLEDARAVARRVGGYPVGELLSHIEDFRGRDAGRQARARAWLTEFCAAWNEKRDLRPVFATYLDEVDDLLTTPDWADQVRDRLGMGDLHPPAGDPGIPVLLLQYTVAETMGDGADHPRLAVPTVLDGTLNPWFFPTPRPGSRAPSEESEGGHTLNLNTVDPNNYRYGVELLHPKVAYTPDHLLRSGWIRRPPGLALETARSWHLPLVRTYMDREDFYGSAGT